MDFLPESMEFQVRSQRVGGITTSDSSKSTVTEFAAIPEQSGEDYCNTAAIK